MSSKTQQYQLDAQVSTLRVLAKGHCHRSLGQRPRSVVDATKQWLKAILTRVAKRLFMAFSQLIQTMPQYLGRCPRLRCFWPSANQIRTLAQYQNAQASASTSGTREKSIRWRFGLVVGILSMLCVGTAQAQFKLDITKVADSAFPSDEDEEEEQLSGQQRLLQQQFGLNNIEQFMFNRHGNRAAAKKAVQQQLKLAIGTIAKDCELSDQQREKLQLAGEVDMARMFAKFDEVRAQFKFENRNDINKLMQKVSPFQQKLQAGLYGKDSLFRRTSKTLLDPTQLELLEEKERQRLKYYFGAEMKQTISRLERQAPLRKSQREALLKLVEEELDLPRVMDKRYMRYFAMYSLAQLKPKLGEILSDRQLAALKPTFQQGERMAGTLKSRGMIE